MEPQEANPLNFGEVPPDTEWAPSDTSKEVDLTVKPFTVDEKAEAERYDGIKDIQSKRRQAIYDVKTGAVDPDKYPRIFRLFARMVDKLPDGRIVIRPIVDDTKSSAHWKTKGFPVINDPDFAAGASSKTLKFIMIGHAGDISTGKNGEIGKIADTIADQTIQHIATDNKEPGKKLKALLDNGTVDEIVDFYIKMKHYDLFAPEWITHKFRPLIIDKVSELRKSEKAFARTVKTGRVVAGLEFITGKLRSIFYS